MNWNAAFGATSIFVTAVLGQSMALAQVSCTPPPARIAICNFECSGAFCGYVLPLLGNRYVGTLATYNTKSDGKPIVIPSGQSQAADLMQFSVQSDYTSLHMNIDEIPDFSLYVVVQQQNGSYQFVSDGNANENFTTGDLPKGTYIVSVIHKLSDPGGSTANYVPTVWLAPTVKADFAGGTAQTARNMGTLSQTQPIAVDAFLERVGSRNLDGTTNGQYLIQNDADWLQVTAPSDGKLSVNFTTTPILDSSGVPIRVGYASALLQGPVAIAPGGIDVQKGSDNYVVVFTDPGFTDTDYGFHYQLQITFQPK